ncbi:uncharacterized protein LOC120820755 isoform X1 [Gasterosteus aculeatus]
MMEYTDPPPSLLISLKVFTLKLNCQRRLVSSEYLQQCRRPHINPSLRASSQNVAFPGFSWLANKARQQGRPQPSPAGESVCCRSAGAGKDAEDVRPPEEDGAGRLSESDASPRRFRHQRGESKEGRELLRHGGLDARAGLHGATSVKMSTGRHLVPENALHQDSFASHVPLRLQIKVSGQSGSLGISIAGGRGSLPYKLYDEGIYISRVNRGGASEKAGVHVGDGLLEVNGLNMQTATHHEAVSALRNAGSCVDMIVLREKPPPPPPREVCDREEAWRVTGGPPCGGQRGERIEDCLPLRREAAVCNGNGICDLESEFNRTLSQMEALKKNHSLQGGKHTMAIPRIILTHPSTSDEDVELLTQIPSREALHKSDRRLHCFDSGFHPP